MKNLTLFLATGLLALTINAADAGWRDRDRGRDDWRGPRGPSCDVVRAMCRARHGLGWDYRRCTRNRGCRSWGM